MFRLALITTLLVAGLASMPAIAADDHVAVSADQLKWGPAPPASPKGAQIAVLAGNPSKLNELIATISPAARVLLAVYCYRRAHLASIGLAIAATCDKDDLADWGGNAGAVLFERSREAPPLLPSSAHATGRRKITLATGLMPAK